MVDNSVGLVISANEYQMLRSTGISGVTVCINTKAYLGDKCLHINNFKEPEWNRRSWSCTKGQKICLQLAKYLCILQRYKIRYMLKFF